MDIQYYGANCVRISTKKASIVIDDNLADIGLKSVTKAGDIVLYTGAHGAAPAGVKIAIDEPGEYEVSNMSIEGTGARAHMDEEGRQSATIFKIVADDIRIAVLGHVYPELSNNQLEKLGTIDILIVPTGGNGYTLDPIGALKLVKEIEPKVIIPTHYDDNAIRYEVPQQPLEEAIKGLAVETREPVAKLKIKTHADIGEVMQVAILERQ